VKQREESAAAFDKGKRPELAAKERAEAEYLRRYLPEMLGRDGIAEVARRLIAELGPDFRKVMPAAMKELRGKADGRLVQQVVKELTG
ncbi:MAG TPA: GatB/YqeY domain-containing protein, partial [Solirubrobacterales bacterium]